MAWKSDRVAALMSELSDALAAQGGRPSAWTKKGSRPRGASADQPKQDGWRCASCSFYNFGFRRQCLQCKRQKELPSSTPSTPPGLGDTQTSPWRTQQSEKGSFANPKGSFSTSKPVTKLQEALREAKAAGNGELEKGLQKLINETAPKPAKEKELSPTDQRARFFAKAKTLSDKVDRQRRMAKEALAKITELEKELFQVYSDIAELPDEIPASPQEAKPVVELGGEFQKLLELMAEGKTDQELAQRLLKEQKEKEKKDETVEPSSQTTVEQAAESSTVTIAEVTETPKAPQGGAGPEETEKQKELEDTDMEGLAQMKRLREEGRDAAEIVDALKKRNKGKSASSEGED